MLLEAKDGDHLRRRRCDRLGGGKSFRPRGRPGFLAGRTVNTLEEVARTIPGTGGAAEVTRVDAVDPAAVAAHADVVAGVAGGIDIAFNATSNEDVQGIPCSTCGITWDFMRRSTRP
jgi:hypothetical protein